MCIVTFSLRYLQYPFLKYSLMSLMVVISIMFVLYQISEKMELKGIFNSVINRKK